MINLSHTGQGPPAGLETPQGIVKPCECGKSWVFGASRQIFHNTNPGDYEGMLIKAGDSETRKSSA